MRPEIAQLETNVIQAWVAINRFVVNAFQSYDGALRGRFTKYSSSVWLPMHFRFKQCFRADVDEDRTTDGVGGAGAPPVRCTSAGSMGDGDTDDDDDVGDDRGPPAPAHVSRCASSNLVSTIVWNDCRHI